MIKHEIKKHDFLVVHYLTSYSFYTKQSLLSFYFVVTGSCYVSQVGELVNSSDLPVSASWVAGTTGTCHPSGFYSFVIQIMLYTQRQECHASIKNLIMV